LLDSSHLETFIKFLQYKRFPYKYISSSFQNSLDSDKLERGEAMWGGVFYI